MLVDETLSTPPYEKSGCRFTYKLPSKFEYEIVGRPIEFGVSGKRSFYTGNSGVIRFTTEDRAPNSSDPPLR